MSEHYSGRPAPSAASSRKPRRSAPPGDCRRSAVARLAAVAGVVVRLGMAAAVVLAVALPRAAAQTAGSAERAPPVLVETAEVALRELSVGRSFVGTVQPLRASTVGSTVEGRVVELLVDVGDAVEEGQTLARLRTTQLEIALAAAKAEWDLRREELSELEAVLPEDVRQADARLRAAEALRDYAKLQLSRAESLLASRTISRDEYQERSSAHAAALHRALENEAALAALTASIEQRLAQARLRVAAQEEAVRRIEDEIAEHTIVAPFAGHVTAKHTEVGQWVAKGSPVADVIETHSVEVHATVPEDAIGAVQLGMTARIEVESLRGRSWEAPVTAIVPRADERSRSFPVKVTLENRPDAGGVLLKPGMFARVTLPIGARGQALMVPKDAVVLGEIPPVVFVAEALPEGGPSAMPADGSPPPANEPNAVARRVPVTLGAAVGAWIEVRPWLGADDLLPGERIVVEGNERIGDSGRMLVTRRRAASRNAE